MPKRTSPRCSEPQFLEVEILATARDWRGISEIKGFDDLFRTRRPPAVTSALLEAIYWTTFEDAAPVTSVYVGGPRTRVRDLIRLPAPAGMRDGAWRLYALEALVRGRPDFGLAEAATASGADLGELADALASRSTTKNRTRRARPQLPPLPRRSSWPM
jgi:hypothetical protein